VVKRGKFAILSTFKKKEEPGMVLQAYNPSTQEAEAEGFPI
jgi:hypothetical protein